MSAFGAFLDPVADKLIVVGGADRAAAPRPRVDALVALIIIGREIAISALREWMAKVGQAKSVAVAFIGKLKTVARWSRSRCCSSTTGCSAARLPVAGHDPDQRRRRADASSSMLYYLRKALAIRVGT